jgi:hypothetical protein
MRTGTRRTFRQEQTHHDVGTLWTMERRHHKARCALVQWPAGWELRVVAGAETILTEQCTHPTEAFSLAERWKQIMHERGWQQIVPQSAQLPDRDDPHAA